MYLVDTNVISAGARLKAAAAADLVKWMDEHSADLYVSAVTVTQSRELPIKLKKPLQPFG